MMLDPFEPARPKRRLTTPRAATCFWVAVGLLATRVLASMLWEYQHYFPPNFEATFLIGRQLTFHGAYRFAFFTHLVVAPISLLLGAFLIMSGRRIQGALETDHDHQSAARRWHRIGGRVQGLLVLLGVVPSGLVMALESHAGPPAVEGFVALSISTGATMAIAIAKARTRETIAHQQWATRCFVLLSSSLILRVTNGGLIMIGAESITTYQANAWLSWMVPLLIYQAVIWQSQHQRTVFALAKQAS